MKIKVKKTVNGLEEVYQHRDHQHGDSCAAKVVRHGDRVDYVHDGCTHRLRDKHVEEAETHEAIKSQE